MPNVAAVVALVAVTAALGAQEGLAGADAAADAWRWRVGGGFSRGKLEYDAGPGLKGRDDAERWGVRAEVFAPCGLGGGIAFAGTSSDSIFLGAVQPMGSLRVDTESRELFAHAACELRTGRLECPLRFGVAVEEFEQTFDRGVGGFDYGFTTLRLEAEPHVALLVEEGLRWSLYARGAIGYGEGDVEGGGPPRDASVFERVIEVGTRLRGDAVEFGIAWVFDTRSYDDETSLNFDTTFEGVLLSFGLVF